MVTHTHTRARAQRQAPGAIRRHICVELWYHKAAHGRQTDSDVSAIPTSQTQSDCLDHGPQPTSRPRTGAQPQSKLSNGPSYSNAVIGTGHWWMGCYIWYTYNTIIFLLFPFSSFLRVRLLRVFNKETVFGTARRGLGGAAAPPGLSSLYQI